STDKDNGTAAAPARYASFTIDQKPTSSNLAGYNSTDPPVPARRSSDHNSISTAGLSLGQHTLWFNADTWNDVKEGDETNNWNSFTFNVVAKPHIVVSNITPVPTTVTQGTKLAFSYTVKATRPPNAPPRY